ncbi:MAG: hypothetical protein KF723_03310 [Rhizobiaceae bacterium]|nr:hypothetical protein [Rhizobiaceae bacterium]
MKIDWPSRIVKRAAGIEGGEALLRYAEDEHVLREMRRYIRQRQHPVVALQGALIPDDLPEGERPDPPLNLKQLAGEIAAFVCESVLGAVRASGSTPTVDNLIFRTGAVFRFPDQIKRGKGARAKPAPGGVDVSLLDDEELEALAEAVAAEVGRRGA